MGGGGGVILSDGGGGGEGEVGGGEGEGKDLTSSCSGSGGGCSSGGNWGPIIKGGSGLMICLFSNARRDKNAATLRLRSACTCFSLLADAILSRAAARSLALNLSSAIT